MVDECAEQPFEKGIPVKNGPTCVVILYAAFCGGVLAFFFSGDWCFCLFSAAFLGGAAAGAVDLLLLKRICSWEKRWIRIGVGVVLGCICGLCFRLDYDVAFEEAFGMKVPAGVGNLKAERHYAGGPGDVAMFIEFTATPEAIQIITGEGRFDVGQLYLEEYEGNWAGVWKTVFGNYDSLVETIWQTVQPMSKPRLYKSNENTWSDPSDNMSDTKLLWDEETGKAYALYTFG